MVTRSTTYGEAFPPELPPTRRYTLSGEPRFEDQVKQDLSRIAADAELSLFSSIRTLLLVGRFARGEGSAIEHRGEPVAFGGYQCVALTDRPTETDTRAIEEFELAWSKHLRVPVRIHICPCGRLGHRHDTLWWLDIGRGNVEALSGDPLALSTLQSVEQQGLRPDEGAWLLCEHTALAAIGLHEPGITPLVLRHRLHCLAMACGDAELLQAGRFAGGMRARLGQLKSLVPGERAEAVADALLFLTRPDLWTVDDEANWQRRLLGTLGRWHMDLEARRVGASRDIRAFVRHRGNLFEESEHAGLLGRGQRLLRQLVAAPLAFPYVEDPLERLARAAAGLTYARTDPSVRLMCARLLGFSTAGTRATDEAIWTQLNALYATARTRRHDPVVADFYA